MSPVTISRSDEDELVLTRREVADILEAEAQRRYRISAEDFIRKVRDGNLDDCGESADLIGLARLLGVGDPLGLAS